MEKIVNLTPHPLVIMRMPTDEEQRDLLAGDPGYSLAPITVRIESSGVARCVQTETEVGTFAGLPVVSTVFGAAVGLPAAEEGTVYVVSSITAQACRGRMDVFVPARPIRDAEGRIVGCAALGRV